MTFDYHEAFQRNIGLITPEEQEVLRGKTIAIPGMGGVGGIHLISLVRQGFEKFVIADPDVYELKNFNRQMGATMNTLGRKKVEVMREMALAINPNCEIKALDGPVTKDNVDIFLEGVDLVVDGIDAFEIEARRVVFNTAYAKKIPVITAGPMGFSIAFLVFMPDGPSFDQYFAMSEQTPYFEKLRLFLIGVAPALLHRTYMKGVDLKEKRGPSSSGAVDLCAGVVTVYAIKILLNKGPLRAVPYYHQFDAMRDRYVVKKLWDGNHNWVQRIKLRIARRVLPG